MATKQSSASDIAAPLTTTQPAEVTQAPVINTPATTTTTYIDLVTGLPAAAPDTQPAAEKIAVKEDAQPTAQTPDNEAPAPESNDDHLFTQADVEKIIRDRLDRQRRRYEQIAKEQDAKAESPADEKTPAKANEAPAPKPTTQTEIPDTIKDELSQIRSQLASVSVEVTQARIGQAIAVEAQRLGVDAGLAAKLVEVSAIEVKDGRPVAESISQAIEALVTQYPNLRTMPGLSAANPARTQQRQRTDNDRRQEYFGGGQSAFWNGGGVNITTQEQ